MSQGSKRPRQFSGSNQGNRPKQGKAAKECRAMKGVIGSKGGTSRRGGTVGKGRASVGQLQGRGKGWARMARAGHRRQGQRGRGKGRKPSKLDRDKAT